MLVLTLPYPISANRYWAHRIVTPKGKRAMALTYVTPEAKAYKEAVGWHAKAAGVRAPLACRVAIEVRLYPHRPLDYAKRMRQHGAAWDDTVQCIDLDNANKVLLDSLKGVVIDDDGWQVRSLHADRMEPDGEARVVVVIRECAPDEVQPDLLGALTVPDPTAPRVAPTPAAQLTGLEGPF